jgi:putative ABC transport system permease protein
LLIACANVANLLLARGSHRSHEMAVRSAMGAARGRLLGQCLVESLLLSVLGAGAGLALAALLVHGARTFGPADVPRLQEVAVDPSALLFTFFLSLLTTLLFGFVPAWRLSRTSPQGCLKESSRTGQVRSTQRLQSSITVAEIAMASVLLISGSLVLQSFVRVLNVPLGFRPRGVFIIRTLFDKARYPDLVKRGVVQKELIERVGHLQGVEVAAAASHLPLSDSRQIGFRLEHAAPDDFHWAENSLVSPGYFRAMGIPILRGRDFTDQDRPDTPLAAVINETLARQYFPGQDPMGQRFHWGDRALFTIIGVAGDVHISALDADPPPMIYNSMFQVQSGASERTALLLRLGPGKERDQGLFNEVQQQIWSLDRDLPVYNFATFETLISESVAQRRFTTVLMLSFAVLALSLALIGLFGVMSYLVAQRQRELAIRVALGANRTGIYWTVMKRGAALAMAGCAIGLALFTLGGRLIRATLYQTSTYDPATLVLVPALLMGVALLATYIPARRATKVDPMVALRYE